MGRVPPSRSAVKPADNVVDKPPERINLSDANALKHKLDSTAAEVVLQSGYTEDHLVSNVKITLGITAIVCALYSQFGPGKFPANYNTVLFCVIAYMVVSVVLQIFCYFKEGEAFLITHPKLGSEYGIRLSSRMERFSDVYVLAITSANKLEDREVKLSSSVTDYFHEDGYLADAKFRHTVSKLLSQYERLDASSAPRPNALNPKKRE